MSLFISLCFSFFNFKSQRRIQHAVKDLNRSFLRKQLTYFSGQLFLQRNSIIDVWQSSLSFHYTSLEASVHRLSKRFSGHANFIFKKTLFRGGSRTAATSKMEHFAIIVKGWKPLTIITKSSILDQTLTIIAKRSILDVAAVLDPASDIADDYHGQLFLQKTSIMVQWDSGLFFAFKFLYQLTNRSTCRKKHLQTTCLFTTSSKFVFISQKYLSNFTVQML